MFSRRDAGYIPVCSLHRVFWPDREAAGRPDLHVHDLRRTGAAVAATTGATLAQGKVIDLKARSVTG